MACLREGTDEQPCVDIDVALALREETRKAR